MGIPEHLTFLLRNLYAGKAATVRTGHGTTDWFKIRKGLWNKCAYLTYMQSTSYEMPCWMKHKLESKYLGEISITSAMQMIPLSGKKGKETKEPPDEGERGERKSWLKTQHSENQDHGIQSQRFLANIRGKSGNSDRFYFLGLQNHCR